MTNLDTSRIQCRLVLCFAMLLLVSCGGAADEPEAELRRWVSEAEAAAEDRDRRALIDKVSVNYADARGNNRDEIGNMFRVYMLRQQSVSIITKIDDITLAGDSAAEMSLTVGMAGTNNRAFGLNADAYRFDLELERDDDEWLLIGARWAELGDELR
jgi:hypothetical protein